MPVRHRPHGIFQDEGFHNRYCEISLPERYVVRGYYTLICILYENIKI